MGHFDFFGPQRTIFGVGEVLMNCFGVYSCSWTTSILYVSVNSYICFNSILRSLLTFWGHVLLFLGPNGLFWGLGKGSKTVFWVYSCSWTTFILYVSVNSGIWFLLNWGHFCLFGALMGYFWFLGRVQKRFGVYSCSCSTFIMYVSVNSGICFLLNWGHFEVEEIGSWRNFGGWGRVQKHVTGVRKKDREKS